MTQLADLASTLRSKNSGVNQVTFDIIFRDRDTYQRVVNSGAVTAETVAKLYNLPVEQVSNFITFDLANAIKFTLYRRQPNGSPGDWDILGCQYYGPLMEIEIP